MISFHARETDDLDTSFALVTSGDTYVLAVKRGVLSGLQLHELDRLLTRAAIAGCAQLAVQYAFEAIIA